jgi:hypothetical protein
LNSNGFGALISGFGAGFSNRLMQRRIKRVNREPLLDPFKRALLTQKFAERQ